MSCHARVLRLVPIAFASARNDGSGAAPMRTRLHWSPSIAILSASGSDANAARFVSNVAASYATR